MKSATDAFEDAEIAREEERAVLLDALATARAQIEKQALTIGEAWELADEGVVEYGTQAWMAIRGVLAQSDDEGANE